MLNIKRIEEYYRSGTRVHKNGVLPDWQIEELKKLKPAAFNSFKTRDEYLAWVKDWKAEYKVLSFRITEAKKARKQGPKFRDGAVGEARAGKFTARAMLFARKEGRAYSRQLKQERLKQAS